MHSSVLVNLYFQDEVFNISGYEKGDKSLDDMYTIFHHTMMCHIQLANYIHENYSDVKIGGMLAYQQIYPATASQQMSGQQNKCESS